MAVSELEKVLLSAVGAPVDVEVDNGSHSPVEDVVGGNYSTLLSLPHLTRIAKLPQGVDGSGNLQSWFQKFRVAIHEATFSAVKTEDVATLMDILATGVAALLDFVRENVTGPEGSPTEDVHWFWSIVAKSPGSQDLAEKDSLKWAEGKLHIDGEGLTSKLKCPYNLLLARTILVEPLRFRSLVEDEMEALSGIESEGLAPETSSVQIGDYDVDVEEVETWESNPKTVVKALARCLPTWFWWSGRCSITHQEVLSCWSSTLRVETAGASEQLEALDMGGVCLLERCLWELKYGRVEAAQKLLGRAEEAIGLITSTTGAMGKRTVHQQDPKAQLILKVDKTSMEGNAEMEGVETRSLGFADDSANTTCGELQGLGESDILDKPQLSEKDSEVPQLNSIQQCIVLARSAFIEKATAKDELRSWRTMPYIEAIQAQPLSRFLFQAYASFQKAKHEFERSRTRERSIVTLENLVNRVRVAQEGEQLNERIRFVYSVPFPSITTLRKENCQQLVASGLVGSAIQAYEEMEMWDNLLLCYRLINKPAQAEALVKKQLEVYPDSPSLWCALGDLHEDDNCYKTAWSRSGHKYARAKRSLARSALKRKDFSEAARCFDRALTLNPLHPEVWFSLGYCYLKIDDTDGALRAFTRCAQLEPDHGESWNNLGALWLKVGKAHRAFWALKEALKHKNGSWETWENYGRASLEAENFGQCLRGLAMTLEISKGKRLQPTLITALLEEHKKAVESQGSTTEEESKSGNKSWRENWKIELGKFLQTASRSPSWTPGLWRLRGHYHERIGESNIAKDCYLTASRLLQGSEWKKDIERFEELSAVLIDLGDNLLAGAEERQKVQESAASVTSEAASLRLTLRSLVKIGQKVFEDSPSCDLLESMLVKIEALEASSKAST